MPCVFSWEKKTPDDTDGTNRERRMKARKELDAAIKNRQCSRREWAQEITRHAKKYPMNDADLSEAPSTTPTRIILPYGH